MRILLVEDSASLRNSLKLGLEKLSYSVDTAATGTEGLNMALIGEYDLLILDLMLPELDGMALLKALRKKNHDIRVLILSARSEPEDKTTGILAGADDYLAKPFSFDELCARLINLMRRGAALHTDDTIVIGDFELNLQAKSFTLKATPFELTPNEYKILECLFVNRNKVITSEKLSEHIAGSYDCVSKNSIEAHLSTARKKARLLGAELPVKNKRGFGYLAVSHS